MNLREPELVPIPAGAMLMGLPACPPRANLHWTWHSGREVSVPAFAIGRLDVTNAQYRAYLADTSVTPPAFIDTPEFGADNQPVCGVSWFDAKAYCDWLAGRTGKAYRLPTDAEWEYAARGGERGRRFPWGEALDPARASFGGAARTAAVGSYPPNEFGLHDMIGNVWNWCADRYEDVSDGVPAKNNPTGGDGHDNRVLRGGSFMTTNWLNLWIAYRHEDPPDLRHESLGFRVAL